MGIDRKFNLTKRKYLDVFFDKTLDGEFCIVIGSYRDKKKKIGSIYDQDLYFYKNPFIWNPFDKFTMPVDENKEKTMHKLPLFLKSNKGYKPTNIIMRFFPGDFKGIFNLEKERELEQSRQEIINLKTKIANLQKDLRNKDNHRSRHQDDIEVLEDYKTIKKKMDHYYNPNQKGDN